MATLQQAHPKGLPIASVASWQSPFNWRVGATLGKGTMWLSAIGAYAFLWMPIVLLMLFSFNDSSSLTHFKGFSLQWYEKLFDGALGRPGAFSSRIMLEALSKSLYVGFFATLISTAIGTLVAISLARGAFKGRRLLDSILFFPLIIPDVTQAFSLALFFKIAFDMVQASTGVRVTSGMGTIIIGHVAFNISYVALIVRARLADMNPRYEEAAADLGASAWQAFWRVTFPLLLPGIIAGGLLAFTMSLDDFIVSFMLSGVGTSTLPVYVQSTIKEGLSPEVNAISTLMMVLSMVFVAVSLRLQSARSRMG
jgi:spermidine/putrescine transport system permease protein